MEKYNLYLETKEGYAQNFKVGGMPLQQGDKFAFSHNLDEFKKMIDSTQENPLRREEVIRLERWFNRKVYLAKERVTKSEIKDGQLVVKLEGIHAEEI